MLRTVHVIFVIFIVRIDNSTCVEINGFLLYCCHCILVRSAIKSSQVPTTHSQEMGRGTNVPKRWE